MSHVMLADVVTCYVCSEDEADLERRGSLPSLPATPRTGPRDLMQLQVGILVKTFVTEIKYFYKIYLSDMGHGNIMKLRVVLTR